MKSQSGKHSARHKRHNSASQPEVFNYTGAVAPLKSHASLDSLQAAKEQEEKASSNTKAFVVAAAGLAAVAGIYLAGCAFNAFYFLPNTKLNGQDVSLHAISAELDGLHENVAERSLTITGAAKELTVKTSDINLHFDNSTIRKSVEQQNLIWLWPLRLFTGSNISLNMTPTYDKAKLDEIVKQNLDAMNKDAVESQNATLAFDEASNAFKIQPEVMGTKLDGEALKELIVDGLTKGKASLSIEGAVAEPKVMQDDPNLAAALEEANAYTAATQELKAAGTTVYTVSQKDISAFVKLGDDLKVTLDEDGLRNWAVSTLEPKTDTAGSARSFTLPDGTAVKTNGGSYGWIADSAELANKIVEAVKAKKAGSIDIPFKQSAAKWAPGAAEWGNRLIDVNLATQHVRMFDDSGAVIFESDVVTGKTSDGHATPSGVYFVNSNKARNQTLIGFDENHDGQPDYKTPVSYWIPFVGNTVAFHDAPWRGAFGGSIYVYNGSHGCVNMPPAKVAELYQLTKVGDVVIVHS